MRKIFCNFDYAYELYRLNKAMDTAQALLIPWPDNVRLTVRHRVSKNNKRGYVYRLEKHPDGTHTSSYQKKEDLVSQTSLIQTYCAEKVLSAAKKLKIILQEHPTAYDPYEIQAVYEDLYQTFSNLTPQPFLPNSLRIERWCSQKIPPRPFPEKLKQLTNRGDLVRSKYEQSIANILFELGISYIYEKPEVFNNKRYLPDFTILDPENGTLVYIEAFGRMDDRDYSLGVVQKVHDYEANGLNQGKDFFMVYDSLESPFDPIAFRRQMKKRFHK